MSTEIAPLEAADETIRRMRAAVEAGDVEAVVALCAPGVVLNSPITSRFRFQGQDDVRELLESVFATLEGIRYYEELGDERSRALFYTASVGRQKLEEATLVRLDDQARIAEFTLWFRPLPGLATLTAGLVPRIARRRGRARWAAAAAATGLLAFLAVYGEPALIRLVRERDRG